MSLRTYKKMAGTSAVFISSQFEQAAPVERDGLTWTETELGLRQQPLALRWQAPLQTTLALEGLETYDPARAGDARYVIQMGMAFMFVEKIRGWVAITHAA